MQKYITATCLMSHVSCLMSHVSCLMSHICDHGGTGIRAALRMLWGNPWGFDSPWSHQIYLSALPIRKFECLGGALHRRTASPNGYSTSRRCFAPTDSCLISHVSYLMSHISCLISPVSYLLSHTAFSPCLAFYKFAKLN